MALARGAGIVLSMPTHARYVETTRRSCPLKVYPSLVSSIRPRFRSRAFTAIPLLLLLGGCKGEDGAEGTTCTIEEVDDQDTLVCSDGTSSPLGAQEGEPGDPGDPGEPGDPGDAAEECTVTDNEDGTFDLSCPDSDPITLSGGVTDDLLIESAYDIPGEACVLGGYVLRVGYDTDDDGILSDSEVTQTEIVCEPLIIDDDVHLTTQEEVDDFRGVHGVTGYLNIGGEDITDLSALEDLHFVGEYFQVWASPVDSLAGLENLKSIGENLWLGELEITSLEGLSGLQTIGGEGAIYGNPLLEDFTGLTSLENLGGLYVYDNESLESLAGLPGIDEVTGDVEFYYNPVLADLSALQLETIGGDLIIYDNDALVDLAGLENLTTIGGEGSFGGNELFADLSALSNLESIGLEFYIYENPSLVEISGLTSLTTVGDLAIWSNPVLVSLDGLAAITTVGDAYVYNNVTLPTCEAEWLIDNITTISGSTDTTGNDDSGTCE